MYKIQPSFSSGELAPALYSRVDLNRYNTGLKTCKNFIVRPHGGVCNRPGTKLVAEVKDSGKATRIVKFIFSETQSYTLEFGEGYVRFYKDHAQIAKSSPDAWLTATSYEEGDFVTQSSLTYYCLEDHTSGTFATDFAAGKWVQQSIYEIPTPYTEEDLFELKFERSADVLYIFHRDYPTRTISRYDDDDWRIAIDVSDDGPFMPENTGATTVALSATTGTAVSLISSAALFENGHVGALWKITHYIPGQTVTTAFTGTAAGTSISCFTTWRLITHGTWTGKIVVEKSTDGGSTWTALRDFSSADDINVDTYGTEDIETNPDPFLIRVRCSTYTSGTANVDLSSDPFYQHGIVRITTVTNSTAAVATVLTAAGSTAAVATWSEGAWSDVRGYPSCGVFHQDRLCMAASTDEPMNNWMTQIGNYTSHRVNATLLDTDAINIKLLTRQLNAVNNLVSLGDLIALTSSTEWKIGADKSVITPASVFARVQGYRGSSAVTPVIIGNQLVYVQSNGTVVRNLGYDFNSDSYTGVDLRILSEHLFDGHEIVELDYQQDPNSIVWCVRDDGILLSMTYMQEQEVVAWSWHETEGEVESICVIPQDGYDELWMIVKRGDKRFVEYMVQRMVSTDADDQYFVDCGISYDVPVAITGATAASPVVITAPSHGFSNGDYVDISDVTGMTELNTNRYKIANVTTHTFELTEEDSGDDINGEDFTAYVSGGYVRKAYTTFSGLDHLEGSTVAILGNGEVYPQQEVSGGEITLSRACSVVHVGLPYTADFETLNIEVPLRDGTAQGRMAKVSSVTFRVINTRGGYVGQDFDSLYESFTPARLRLGLAPALYTGDVKETLGGKFANGGRVCYRQVDPLPVEISAVIPEVIVS